MTEKKEHPAYGVMRVSRVTGGDCRLFGSKIQHSNWMSIEISTASVERNLSQDWIYPRNVVVSVEMSEAQWATLVSSPGVGSGVPCTIKATLAGPMVRVEPMPDPEPEHDAARREFAARMDSAPGPVKKADLNRIYNLLQHLTNLKSNMRFAKEQFDRALEQSIEAAKADLDAHITMTAQRLGMDAAQLPGLLESKGDT